MSDNPQEPTPQPQPTPEPQPEPPKPEEAFAESAANIPHVEVTPILEQMRAEWVELVRRDKIITKAQQRREEAYYVISAANQEIRVRAGHLRKQAVMNIQKRLGVRTIPGYINAESGTRKEVLKLSEQLRKLIAKENLTLPPELDPTSSVNTNYGNGQFQP